MTKKREIFRSITLGLQVIAIIAYFIFPLIAGNGVGIVWLIPGVVHTAMFCTVFFRDSKRRRALSIIFLILVIFWCLFLVLLNLILSNFVYTGIGAAGLIYLLSSFLAIIFALAAPRKLQESHINAPVGE